LHGLRFDAAATRHDRVQHNTPEAGCTLRHYLSQHYVLAIKHFQLRQPGEERARVVWQLAHCTATVSQA
jgi:hypothetical protein